MTMRKVFCFLLCLAWMAAACGTSSLEKSADLADHGGSDAAAEVAEADVAVLPDAAEDGLGDLVPADHMPEELPPAGCQAGDGCFLDPCEENGQCQSGFCVEHMGEGVCTQVCEEECPPGWSCRQTGTGPDVTFICISDVANLCRPCASGSDCKSPGGAEDVCVDYGAEGSFCGGNCVEDTDCPWGFSCGETVTVGGVPAKQCVADAGVCPCTAKSVLLGLSTPCERTSEFGTCHGQRVCSDLGLSDCDAAVPAQETCNGVDDDCDGEADEPDLVEGFYVGLCDDGNPCTKDSCTGTEGCVNEVLATGTCDDGDPCTVADHCVGGSCQGDPVECDDDNPCTENVCTATGGCEYPPVAGECDDQEVCTLGDHCVAGECVGEAVDCDCEADADCAALEDGDLCNGTLFCNTAKVPYHCAVAPQTLVTCPEPDGPDAPCLAAVCDPGTGGCSLVAASDGKPCDDGNGCTLSDTCQEGVCVGGPAANCNDGNPCTDDACVPAEGCLHAPNAVPCNDGDACTTQDACGGGECQGGPALGCDDGNVCTTDSCDPAVGCVHGNSSEACDDGDPCTLDDQCKGGACLPGGVLSCDDGNPCTADSCVAGEGCAHLSVDGACSDGDPCTLNDQCAEGECVAGPSLDCDDGNPCTEDTCTAAGDCAHADVAGDCSDGNACTLGDHCAEGKCVYGSLLKCDDGNPCTNDLCDPQIGCVTQVNKAPCDDGNACTTKDTCALGSCVGGPAPVCDDGNLCTDDSCAPEVGCVHAPNTAPCDDENECTADDVCKKGWCGGAPVSCDDGNSCTDDGCEPELGCFHEVNDAPCNDGDFCTVNDVCSQGVCVGGDETPCDDGLFCNGTESCQSDKGCLAGTPPLLDDEVACTVDSCDEENDVVLHAPDHEACPEPGLCESSACVPGEGCMVETVPDCCGNLAVEEGEACDDGNLDKHDGCVACALAECGDGFRWQGEEDCDGEEFGPESCADLLGPDYEGEVLCGEDCAYDTSLCVGPLGTANNPATSCKAILDAGDSTGDGVYHLKAGEATVKAWCDMTGGGWTLVTSWVYSLTGGQTWGGFDTGVAEPSPSVKHALPFRSIFPSPSQAKFVYTGNNQTLTFTLAGGAQWQTQSQGCRIALNNGQWLIFELVHCPNGQGICVNNGAYSGGFNCDGDSGQIAGQGLFNECTQNEFCNCGDYGWKYASGGCSAAVCQPKDLLAVYLR
jgi:hypothetical protein